MSRSEAATDAELTLQFAAGRDQHAFAELVARHGPMVRAVARRLLRCEQDAEDVFQSTFLAFAASAERIRRPGAVGAWLHETAVRSAKRLVDLNVRWKRTVRAKASETPEAYVVRMQGDLQEVLDDELRRLPLRLRAAVVLCDLEGVSRNEAAVRLGLPVSTLRDHVLLGRRRLCARLKRRGMAVTVAGLAAVLGRSAKAAPALTTGTPQALAGRAVRFAAGASAEQIGISTSVYGLTQGVLHAMTIAKTSTIAAAVLAASFTFGTLGGVTNAVIATARGGTLFLDDFDDGNHADGSPATWELILSPHQSIETSDGDLVLSLVPGSTVFQPPIVGAANLELKDVSLRTQARIENVATGLDHVMSLFARADRTDVTGYEAVVSDSGTARLRRLTDVSADVLDESTIEFSISQEDVVMQLDVFGSTIEFWAWPAGTPRPEQPLLSATDGFHDRVGTLGVTYSPELVQGAARYRWIQVADAPIAANAMLPGDANVDGMVDLADFNLLKAAFGTDDPFADFNEDGVVDLADFNLLKANFGEAAAVPEPRSWVLASLSAVASFMFWRRPRRVW